MRREIVIDAAGAETRVAIVEDGRLVELMHERDEELRMVGDMYLGRVEAVLPGIQAAFVDIGTEKSAFLHASDIQEAAVEEEDEDDDEPGDDNGAGNGNGRGGSGRRDRRNKNYPPIQDVLTRGQELIVQVTKEPIGTKGPRVTSQISMPGRFIVFIPAGSNVGVSRKIGEREERSRLRALARDALGRKSGGLIVRTVGEELTKKALQDELATLRKTWTKIQRRAKSMKAPALLHQEAEMTSGLIRDVFSGKVDLLTVNSRELAHQAKSYLGRVSPELLDRIKLFEEERPIFEAFGIEDEIQVAFRRRVELKSGGHIVIEHTEALVAIDVNTGSYTGRKDPAKTILRTNLEAASEIARQLRLRDIGGIIVCDFIDMDEQANRDKVLQEMRGHVGRDRARAKLFGITDLGLLQMSRQRVRPSLIQMMTVPCDTCGGTGRVLSPDTVVRRIERSILRAQHDGEKRDLTVRVHPSVALYLLEEEPAFLRELGKKAGLDIDVRDDPIMGHDEYRLLAAPADTDVTSRYAVA